jgi:hypothetical protein
LLVSFMLLENLWWQQACSFCWIKVDGRIHFLAYKMRTWWRVWEPLNKFSNKESTFHPRQMFEVWIRQWVGVFFRGGGLRPLWDWYDCLVYQFINDTFFTLSPMSAYIDVKRVLNGHIELWSHFYRIQNMKWVRDK